MLLYSWNINGIRSAVKKGAFQDFINTHKPDILCLQETKAEQGQVVIDLPDYQEYWNSASKKGYSGTAIFTKFQPDDIRCGFSKAIQKRYHFLDAFGDLTSEGRVISAKINGVWIVTVYTPNSKDTLERLTLRHEVWDPAFLAHCKELEKSAPVIFCGDLNVAHKEIDLARPKENVGKHGFTDEERQGFDRLVEAGFIDTFRHLHPKTKDAYTWWTAWANARARNIGWRIDYFLVSQSLQSNIRKAAVHPDILGSDHCPVSLEIDL